MSFVVMDCPLLSWTYSESEECSPHPNSAYERDIFSTNTHAHTRTHALTQTHKTSLIQRLQVGQTKAIIHLECFEYRHVTSLL